MEFSNEKWMLDYALTCDQSLLFYAEFLRAVVIVTMIFVINAATYIRMYFYNRRNYQKRNTLEAALMRRRREVEVNFVRQVSLQGLAYMTELITYFFVSLAFPQKWPNFLMTTWAWIMVHTLDGFITLIFNRQFRYVLFSPDHSAQAASATLISNKSPIKRSAIAVLAQEHEEDEDGGEAMEIVL